MIGICGIVQKGGLAAPERSDDNVVAEPPQIFCFNDALYFQLQYQCMIGEYAYLDTHCVMYYV